MELQYYKAEQKEMYKQIMSVDKPLQPHGSRYDYAECMGKQLYTKSKWDCTKCLELGDLVSMQSRGVRDNNDMYRVRACCADGMASRNGQNDEVCENVCHGVWSVRLSDAHIMQVMCRVLQTIHQQPIPFHNG